MKPVAKLAIAVDGLSVSKSDTYKKYLLIMDKNYSEFEKIMNIYD